MLCHLHWTLIAMQVRMAIHCKIGLNPQTNPSWGMCPTVMTYYLLNQLFVNCCLFAFSEISQLKMVGESGTDAQFKSGSYVSGTNRVWPSLLKFLELVSTIYEQSLKTIAMSQSNWQCCGCMEYGYFNWGCAFTGTLLNEWIKVQFTPKDIRKSTRFVKMRSEKPVFPNFVFVLACKALHFGYRWSYEEVRSGF